MPVWCETTDFHIRFHFISGTLQGLPYCAHTNTEAYQWIWNHTYMVFIWYPSGVVWIPSFHFIWKKWNEFERNDRVRDKNWLVKALSRIPIEMTFQFRAAKHVGHGVWNEFLWNDGIQTTRASAFNELKPRGLHIAKILLSSKFLQVHLLFLNFHTSG